MPLMPKQILQSIVFIYSNANGARADKGFIGTGFIVDVPSPSHPTFHIDYIVTNFHIIKGLAHTALRMNSKDGGVNIVKNVPFKAWAVNSKYDLAVTKVNLEPSDFSFVPTPIFVDAEKMALHKIGAGDDVCLIGRVVREGMSYKQRNVSVLRFGNIALVPQYEEKMFLVELRSIAGHSGSPVIAYCPPYALDGSRDKEEMWSGFLLLGINRGHLREFEEIVSRKDLKTRSSNWVSQTNMAMSQIVPAWCIAELLNSPVLTRDRAARHAELVQRLASIKPK